MKKINRWLWAVLGIIFSFSSAMMLIGGRFSLENFYDQGEVCEIVGMDLELEGTNLLYLNPSDTFFTITDDLAVKDYIFYENKWNYLLFEISDLSVSALPAFISYFDENGTVKAEQQITFTEGWNVMEPIEKKFTFARLSFLNCKGEHLRIRSALTRSELGKFSGKKFVFYSGVFLLLYCIMSIVVVYCFRKYHKNRKKRHSHWWMNFYLHILEMIYSKMQRIPVVNLSKKTRQYLRIFCILTEILYTTAAVNADRMKAWYPMSMGFHILFLLVLSVLLVEPVRKKVHWNTKLCYIWGILCITMCISDFVVGRVFIGVGYVFLFVFGVFYYCWRQMERPTQLLKETGIAVQISFVFILLFCLMCRPPVEGIRYAGCYINPNPFGRYLISVFVVVFVQLEYLIRKRSLTWKKGILFGIEIDVLCYFLWQSQCRGAMFAFVLLVLAVFIRFIKIRILASVIRDYLRVILISAVCLFPVMYTVEWGLYHIPYFLGTQVYWKKDALYAKEMNLFLNPFVEQVYASASRILETLRRRSLDSVSSGRITYWKAYLRNMNLWGHEFRCQVNGGSHSAHNMFLDIAYRYGVAAAGVYIVFWGTFLKEVCSKLSLRHPYSFMAAGCVISYVGMALLDTLEQPWVYFAWVLAYMSLGYYLLRTDTIKENERLHEKKMFHN